ncbi:hypothetical protein PoB_001978300 [Plakobranchus ocellatus]|uniref:Uncharacterized protein n=1 Tax=Plakobranchus ocellatus TaxID=259542 RepID=A0AAV3ZFM6_9GAST|nr:hypothetical protein PoB_001978300 [Plakobranchus ocellatus]
MRVLRRISIQSKEENYKNGRENDKHCSKTWFRSTNDGLDLYTYMSLKIKNSGATKRPLLRPVDEPEATDAPSLRPDLTHLINGGSIATFFGHVMRREKLENLVTAGMLEGKRSRGKQREKLIEGLTDWLKAGKSLEAIEATKDRKKWRTMIANAVKQGT